MIHLSSRASLHRQLNRGESLQQPMVKLLLSTCCQVIHHNRPDAPHTLTLLVTVFNLLSANIREKDRPKRSKNWQIPARAVAGRLAVPAGTCIRNFSDFLWAALVQVSNLKLMESCISLDRFRVPLISSMSVLDVVDTAEL